MKTTRPKRPVKRRTKRRGPAMTWDSLKPEDQAAIKRIHHGDEYTNLSDLKWRYVWGGGKPGYWEAVS